MNGPKTENILRCISSVPLENAKILFDSFQCNVVFSLESRGILNIQLLRRFQWDIHLWLPISTIGDTGITQTLTDHVCSMRITLYYGT
jgi:hypothetical protein